MNYDRTLMFKILQVFIISLPFISFGIDVGGDTVSVAFLSLFTLALLIIIEKQEIPIDRISVTLLVFFAVLIFSVFHSSLYLNELGPGVRMARIIPQIKNFKLFTYIKELKQLIMFFIMIIHFLVLCTVLRKCSSSSINKLIWFFINISFLVSLYSIYQFFGIQFKWPFIDILRNSQSYMPTPIDAASNWVHVPRACAFMAEPAFWGSFLLIPISLILPFVFRTMNKKTCFFLFIFLVAEFLSFSRTSWIGLMIIFIYFMLRRVEYKVKMVKIVKLFLIISPVIIVLFIFTMPYKNVFIDQLSPGKLQDFSAKIRFQVQTICFLTFLKYPILGIGWGNTEFVLLHLTDIHTWRHHAVTNNWYLQLLLETGVVGFSVFMIFLYQLWNRLKTFEKKIRLSATDKNIQDIILGLKLSFIAILVIWFNLVSYNFSYTWFILSLIAVLPDVYKNTEALKSSL